MLTEPSSIPSGLQVELSRQRLLPGSSGTADEWMATLNTRLVECEATLDREHVALELAFRLEDENGEWLYWLMIRGPGGECLDESIPIDRDHVAFAKRCKPPGWEDATAQLLLATSEVRTAILAAARLSDPKVDL
jgi:hypothetical protein